MTKPFLPLFPSFEDLKAAVRKERGWAALNAQRGSRLPFFRSRGTWLTTAGKAGQCAPLPAAECPDWRGTKREVENLIALVLSAYPEVTQITIEGGYDGAERLTDFSDGLYEPWVGAWEVLVWERPAEAYQPVQAELFTQEVTQ